jgi:hypothetical protein
VRTHERSGNRGRWRVNDGQAQCIITKRTMIARAGRSVAILVLALLPIAFVPLVGTWVTSVTVLILALLASLLVAALLGWRAGPLWRKAVVPSLSVLGGLIGVGSAVYALTTVGGVVPYSDRVSMGYSAIALSVAAGGAGLLAARRPATSAAITVGAGLVGGVAINLFYINTYYILAVPLWLIAAVVALATSTGREDSSVQEVPIHDVPDEVLGPSERQRR